MLFIIIHCYNVLCRHSHAHTPIHMDTKTYYFSLPTYVLEFNEGMNGLLSNHPSSQLTLIGSDTDTSGCRAALRSATSTADKTSDLASPSS